MVANSRLWSCSVPHSPLVRTVGSESGVTGRSRDRADVDEGVPRLWSGSCTESERDQESRGSADADPPTALSIGFRHQRVGEDGDGSAPGERLDQ